MTSHPVSGRTSAWADGRPNTAPAAEATVVSTGDFMAGVVFLKLQRSVHLVQH